MNQSIQWMNEWMNDEKNAGAFSPTNLARLAVSLTPLDISIKCVSVYTYCFLFLAANCREKKKFRFTWKLIKFWILESCPSCYSMSENLLLLQRLQLRFAERNGYNSQASASTAAAAAAAATTSNKKENFHDFPNYMAHVFDAGSVYVRARWGREPPNKQY